ncbi:hypothetical protein HPB50_008257 [Hyalomma asiaticum]|uniref:Uncharacterized protein n=1 Tax=Hyalomma asiaticum TaxID=266040 RepID=A0ACB7RN74_HYAAI|nr:hypothetical protein HPB50_008257 [Hyalomma asiaticum]
MIPSPNTLAGIDAFTKGAFLTSSKLTQTFIGTFCNAPLREACFLPIDVAVGASAKQLNEAGIDAFTKGAFLTSSKLTQTFIGTFCNAPLREACFLPIDVAVGASAKQLNEATPPQFPLGNVRSRIGLFRGPSDRLADPKDIDDLVKKIGGVVALNYHVPQQTFQHLDFVLGSYATDIVHEPMMQFLSKYSGI